MPYNILFIIFYFHAGDISIKKICSSVFALISDFRAFLTFFPIKKINRLIKCIYYLYIFIYNKKISHSIIKVLYMQTFNEKKREQKIKIKTYNIKSILLNKKNLQNATY